MTEFPAEAIQIIRTDSCLFSFPDLFPPDISESKASLASGFKSAKIPNNQELAFDCRLLRQSNQNSARSK
jgi:hypothetical protein